MFRRTAIATFATFSVFLVALSSCTPTEVTEPEVRSIPPEESANRAIAVLYPTEGSDVRGVITFTKVEGGIRVVADIEGLTPGNHGFHIHEFGDCTALDAKSAGGHFNPDGTPHGGPTDAQRHVGDLGNVVAGEDGQAHYEWTDPLMTFSGSHNIIGRAVIVHAGEDDLTSQPTGNAGGRVACGIIGIAQ